MNVEEIANVISIICLHKNVSFEDVRSKSKCLDISMARQLIIHILHYQFNLCTPALSRYVNINLRGVKRANEKITNMLKYDSNFRAEYQAILDKIKSGAH